MIQDLTVFVISSGINPNFEDCVAALEKQTISAKIEVIRDYSPMSVAFQQMLLRCTTDYFIQCDEDMILEPNAIEVLYTGIKASPANICMVCYQLKDVHLDFIIFGIKAYKHTIFKNFPYNLNVTSCEMEQLNRIKQAGYEIQTIERIVGLHSPKWTTELIFGRYYDLMNKYKVFKYKWLEDMPYKLWNIFIRVPSENNLYAMFGAFMSVVAEGIYGREKDFNVKKVEYLRMREAISTPHSATLYITNKCNCVCRWCLRQHGYIEDFPDMDVLMVKKFLGKFPTVKGVCICGYGEPLLNRNLVPIIQYLKSSNRVVGLITNGILLGQEMSALERVVPDYISVSLNATNQAEHEYQTGVAGQFSAVINGIKRCQRTKVPLYISYVCDKTNIQAVPKFLDFMADLGIKKIFLHNVLPHNLLCVPDSDKVNNFLSSVLTIGDQNVINSLKEHPYAKAVVGWPVLINPEKPKRMCVFPWTIVAVNGNGNISICNSIMPPSAKYGNLDDIDVWHSSQCSAFRETFSKEEIELFCKYCFRNYC